MKKMTIAERKAQNAPAPVPKKKAHIGAGLTACIPFAALWYVTTELIAGYTFTALVCACVIAVILFYTFIPLVGRVFPRFAKIAFRLVTAGLAVLLVMFVCTEFFIIREAMGNPDDTADYLLVLGAKVREDGPSLSLQNRIDAACTYLSEHPQVIAVVSGGQGEDESMTEAQCMFDNLTAMGIPAERIWMEDRACSTDENIRFSLDLIEEKTGTRPEKLAVLSSEYHLLRAKLMAEKQGITFVGVPARTTNPFQLINHGMREFAGIWHFLLLGD